MSELAVIGNNEFVMGFELIGIKRIFESETADKLKTSFAEAINDKSIGIIVTDSVAMNKLEANFRRIVEKTVAPVIVVLSKDELAHENLRNMIKKAIGIDLWSR